MHADLHLHCHLAYQSTAQILFHCLLPPFHLSPCPIKIPRTSYPYPPKTLKSVTSLRFLEKQTETRQPYFPIHLFQRHKANSKKINRRKSLKEAASQQGSQEVSSSHGRINILEKANYYQRESFSCHGSSCKGATEHFGRYIKEGVSAILGTSFWTLEVDCHHLKREELLKLPVVESF